MLVKIEIIIINLSDTYGGQEKFVKILIDDLIEKYSQFKICFFGGPARLIEEIKTKTTIIDSLENYKGNNKDTVYLLNGLAALYNFTVRLKKEAGVSIIFVQHSSYKDKQAGYFKFLIRQILLAVFLRLVDTTIRVCESALPSNYLFGKQIATIHNGVPINEYKVKQRWNSQVSSLHLLMVGAITKNKNQYLAVELLSRVSGANLTVVGDGPDKHNVVNKARHLNVLSRIEFVGEQQDIYNYYLNADVLLLLSEYEALPFSVLEAMAVGTPVIGFNVGGVSEIISNGIDGVLVEPGDIKRLESSVINFLDDPKLRSKMGVAARRKVEAKFSSKRMGLKYVKTINKLLNISNEGLN